MISELDINHFLEGPGASLNGDQDLGYTAVYLRETFGIDDAQGARQVGNTCTGLTAYYIDLARRNLYLIVGRWTTSYHSFEDPLARLIDGGLARVFAPDTQSERLEPFLDGLKGDLEENQALIDRVWVRLVFAGDEAESRHSQVIQALREDLEAKKTVIDDYFGPDRQVALAVQIESTATTQKVTSIAQKTHRYTVDFAQFETVETPAGETLYIGLVRLLDLHKMHEEMGQRFFERNIRAGLTAERAPNREIRRAMARVHLETDPPELFTFNHNGVTIAAEHLELDGSHASITEPRLLNGAQTVTTLGEYLARTDASWPVSIELSQLGSIRVIAKIITKATQDFITSVTICNNRQNPVEPWNLRANDQIQLRYQDWFGEELGIFYERQENAFVNLTEADITDLGIVGPRPVEIRTLAQTLLAARGDIDKVARLREVFENDDLYGRLFREKLLSTDPRDVILAYKIQGRLGVISKTLAEVAPDKWRFLAKARPLLWALLIQGVLNSKRNLPSLRAQFGTSLRQELEYTNILVELATGKIRLIMTAAARDDRYKQAIEEEKTGFVRTRPFYRLCMDIAGERHGWQKVSLS